ncbi:MAG: hypothetical protein ACK4FP_02660 [Azonexus sp.]
MASTIDERMHRALNSTGQAQPGSTPPPTETVLAALLARDAT